MARYVQQLLLFCLLMEMNVSEQANIRFAVFLVHNLNRSFTPEMLARLIQYKSLWQNLSKSEVKPNQLSKLHRKQSQDSSHCC